MYFQVLQEIPAHTYCFMCQYPAVFCKKYLHIPTAVCVTILLYFSRNTRTYLLLHVSLSCCIFLEIAANTCICMCHYPSVFLSKYVFLLSLSHRQPLQRLSLSHRQRLQRPRVPPLQPTHRRRCRRPSRHSPDLLLLRHICALRLLAIGLEMLLPEIVKVGFIFTSVPQSTESESEHTGMRHSVFKHDLVTIA